MIFYGLDMRSRGGSCVGAWDEYFTGWTCGAGAAPVSARGIVLHGLDMRSLNGSCVGAWDEIYASLYPVMQLDSASLHLAHGLRPMDKNV